MTKESIEKTDKKTDKKVGKKPLTLSALSLSSSISLQKVIFKRNIPGAINKKELKNEIRNKFASPTDRLLSPCSQKLNDHKSRLFKVKSAPTKLTFGGVNKSFSDKADKSDKSDGDDSDY